MYLRNGQFDIAERMVKESLNIHFATGRLWATLVQIKHARITSVEDSENCYKTFLNAVWEIPKSGEVWCEGARILMSPISHIFDLSNAEKFLRFAIQFTPQYGDSFLELMRLYIIQGRTKDLVELKRSCIHSEPNYGVLWFYFKHLGSDSSLDIWNQAEDQIRIELASGETNLKNYSKRLADDASLPQKSLYWTGCLELNKLYASGTLKFSDSKLSGVSDYERWRNVYGFEQIVNAKSGNKKS